MTFIPFEERHKVRGVDGPTYHVRSECSHPACDITVVERHHLCRRSFLGGPFDWIEYEGVPIQNVVGLCNEHHRMVTENKARIEWSPLGHFKWVQRLLSYGKLNPHPAIGGLDDHTHLDKTDVHPDICPTCQRPKRRRGAQEKKRARQAWSIHIPKDERENGADVLDTLLEEARVEMAKAGLGYGDEDNARYFVLAAVLGLFVSHGMDVMG